ncbi:MAG: hypothetical protein KatS3mg033_1916 [Thermonema sp.]|uniref:hypothetical protein n=1 Tax=Thermonema sp. TaxID=2231181 RepID=UPI0021DDCB53|nr:hypothetical protein [Thermonema sp.]GIV40116.1 MAG: hypothetical protein KatS3mg033_1916 [Thermonema sp.]
MDITQNRTKRQLRKLARVYFNMLGYSYYEGDLYVKDIYGCALKALKKAQMLDLCRRLHAEACRRKRLEMAVYAAARRALDKAELPEAELLRHARKYRFVAPGTVRLNELTENELKQLKKDFNALWRQQKSFYYMP